MLYKKSADKELNEQLFMNPTSEYRGAPFWAWNCRLDKGQLLKQIAGFKKMGMGGFHIHCRIGLDTEYLGEEFFSCVRACKEEAEKQNMLCWLYDEDRWPSGSAGGTITKGPENRTRFLVFSPAEYHETREEAYNSTAGAVRSENRLLLGKYKIILNEEGYLTGYERVADDFANDADIWCACLEISGDTPWFNNQAYVNTLDKNAIDQFIQSTHEKYYAELKDGFGSVIPAIFTDEPQTCHKEALNSPFEKRPVIIPFTDDFDETFQQTFGLALLDHLPELFWEMDGPAVSQVRYYYHRHVCERFSQAFGDNVGDWCKKHGILLTGHMMHEITLHSQTMAAGEVMRPLKGFGLPGIDMLCDRRELSTAKQAQSVARQLGREGVMSELYGVTGWAFDFRNHKLAGDWQAALGVTVRVPHLTWVSMEGEAKRDYPASIGYQSPWYEEYPYIENHFARLNTALTRGVPAVRVGVIHPVESYWLYWGNQEQTSVVRQTLEANFENIIKWLLFGLIDFDFISEAILSEEEDDVGPGFKVGKMSYEVIIIPECRTLRSSTFKALAAFAASGGKVIFAGQPPKYLDAKESSLPSELAEKCFQIPYERGCLLEALEPYRDIDIKDRKTGSRGSNLFYQLRNDGDRKWIFICHVNKPLNEHICGLEEWEIKIKGEYKPVIYDTINGEITPITAEYKNGNTLITYYCSQHDSLLLALDKKTDELCGSKPSYIIPKNKKYLPQPKSYILEEPNVMLLDMAEYSFDDGEWQEEDEILRIDNKFRQKLNYPLRMEALAQPWVQPGGHESKNTLRLRFKIDCSIEVNQPIFAMERPENARIYLNGSSIPSKAHGWYVDESIQKVPLSKLIKGENILEITIPFGPKTNVEWCYLLGDFGVQVCGRKKRIIEAPKKIYYGDFTQQGLPFYAGNIIYEIPVECRAGCLYLETSHYRGALVQVELDGGKVGNIVLAPYQINCGHIEEGAHTLRLKIFGNRSNAFGAVHNADYTEEWHGPNLWRTTGSKWSYEYQLQPMGILTTPQYWVE